MNHESAKYSHFPNETSLQQQRMREWSGTRWEGNIARKGRRHETFIQYCHRVHTALALNGAAMFLRNVCTHLSGRTVNDHSREGSAHRSCLQTAGRPVQPPRDVSMGSNRSNVPWVRLHTAMHIRRVEVDSMQFCEDSYQYVRCHGCPANTQGFALTFWGAVRTLVPSVLCT
jgi:hypothetical protein